MDARTDRRTDTRTDNVKTVYPLQTKFAGGIKTNMQIFHVGKELTHLAKIKLHLGLPKTFQLPNTHYVTNRDFCNPE